MFKNLRNTQELFNNLIAIFILFYFIEEFIPHCVTQIHS